MEHRRLEDMEKIAALHPTASAHEMSPNERLERWAALLERHGGHVRPLHGTEYVPRAVRLELRADDSPLTVAWHDPVLRSQGLAGDSYADALRFFRLDDAQAHYILCDCHYHGYAVSAAVVAQRIRQIALTRTSASGALACLTAPLFVATATALALSLF